MELQDRLFLSKLVARFEFIFAVIAALFVIDAAVSFETKDGSTACLEFANYLPCTFNRTVPT